jgi:predicted flap endonuclease-1-like 5' DNA nuclease
MATKTKKTAEKAPKKVSKPSVAKKVNTGLINASIAAINTTVENGEKWQKLASKLIKKSEKIRKQQINMIFDTAEAVKGQFITGTGRMKELVGIDDEMVEKAKDVAMKNPVSKKVADIVDKVSESPIVQKAEKATEDLKDKSVAKYKEIKEDVLDQASKIVHLAEDKIEDAKAELKKEAKKAKPKKRTTKKTKASKTKAAPKKKVAKKTVAPKAKATVKSKATTKKVTKTAVVDNLQLINGIGPKTETVFNNNGIKTFAALAKLETPAITTILEKEGIRFAAVQVEIWQKQAEVAVKDGVEGLAKWIENYKTS